MPQVHLVQEVQKTRKEQEKKRLYKETLRENFEIYKVYFSDSANLLNDPLIKIIQHLVENNVLFDLDFFWLEAYADYISLCQNNNSKKFPGCRLLVNMIRSSLISALKREKDIDFPSKGIILEVLNKMDYEKIVLAEKAAREEESNRLMEEANSLEQRGDSFFEQPEEGFIP